MTASVTHYQAGMAAEMERALKVHVGADPWPPVAGIKYAACGIYADYPRFAAFVVVHPRKEHPGLNDVPAIDGVFINISETEARAMARGYDIDPNAHLYGADHLETDTLRSPLVGLPLSQAIWLASQILARPPPPLRVRYRSWRHGLIDERIEEICKLLVDKWGTCWEGDVQVRELSFSGETVERLTRTAFDYLERDDLDAADRCCEEAEAEMGGGEDITVRPRRRRRKAARK